MLIVCPKLGPVKVGQVAANMAVMCLVVVAHCLKGCELHDCTPHLAVHYFRSQHLAVHSTPPLPTLSSQRVAEMVAKGQDYKKEMAKLKAAKAAAKAKAAAAASK